MQYHSPQVKSLPRPLSVTIKCSAVENPFPGVQLLLCEYSVVADQNPNPDILLLIVIDEWVEKISAFSGVPSPSSSPQFWSYGGRLFYNSAYIR